MCVKQLHMVLLTTTFRPVFPKLIGHLRELIVDHGPIDILDLYFAFKQELSLKNK